MINSGISTHHWKDVGSDVGGGNCVRHVPTTAPNFATPLFSTTRAFAPITAHSVHGQQYFMQVIEEGSVCREREGARENG